MTIPKEDPKASQHNSKLTNNSVSQKAASSMNNQIGELNLEQGATIDAGETDEKAEDDASQAAVSAAESKKSIDWDKVGKIYKPESAIEDIINREVSRLGKAFDMQIGAQDIEMEEKFKAGGGKKK